MCERCAGDDAEALEPITPALDAALAEIELLEAKLDFQRAMTRLGCRQRIAR